LIVIGDPLPFRCLSIATPKRQMVSSILRGLVLTGSHDTTVRRGNVLIGWAGREDPLVAAALRRLR